MLSPLFTLVLVAGAELPVAPPPRPLPPPGVDPALADWTPRPAAGKAAAWEKATDKDWIDARFRDTDTGPFLGCTTRYPFDKIPVTVYKAAVVKLGAKGDAAAVFDRNTLRMSAAWTGGYLAHSDRRFGLLNTPTPKGDVLLSASLPAPGWADPRGGWDTREKRYTAPLSRDWAQYKGLYLHGPRVAFKYTVGKREVLESADSVTVGDYRFVTSALEVGPGTADATRFLCDLAGGSSTTLEVKGLSVITSGTGRGCGSRSSGTARERLSTSARRRTSSRARARSRCGSRSASRTWPRRTWTNSSRRWRSCRSRPT